MSLFDDLSNAKSQGRGLQITEPALGEDINFVVHLDDIKLQRSARKMGTMFIPEFTILRGTEANPPGAKRSWVQFPEHRRETDPGNVKLFVAACLGIPGSDPDVPPEQFRAATEGGFNGTVLNLNVAHIKTQSGWDFFVHTWSPFAGDAAELIAQLPVPAPTAPTTPVVPPAPTPAPLTQSEWLTGKGPGENHPTNPAYEWNPQHPEWGTRLK